MLRIIMIFPQFSNIEIINEIRDRYDPLAKQMIIMKEIENGRLHFL